MRRCRAALTKDRALAKAFEALTPGRQRAYVMHFTGATKAEARAARIASVRPTSSPAAA